MRGDARLLELALFLLLLAAGLVARLAHLQIEQFDFWETEARRVRTRSHVLPFRRGSILDATGRELASTESAYDLGFEFRTFRRDSQLGRLLLCQWLWTGERPTLREVAEDPRSFLEPFLSWTVADYRRLSPVERRRDLCWYLCSLCGESSNKALIQRLNEAGGSEPYYPLLALQAPRIVRHVEEEAQEIVELERDLGLRTGELSERIERAIEWIDGQVVRQMALRPAEQRDFLLERSLHREFDTRIRGLVQEVPHEIVHQLEASARGLPGLIAEEKFQRSYPAENQALALLVGSVRAPTDEERGVREAHQEQWMHRRLLESPTREDLLEQERLSEAIQRDDVVEQEEVGSFGLEAAYESLLRGRRGTEKLETDGSGGVIELLDRELPQHGLDLVLTLDLGMQQAAERALADQPRAGALVLLELPGCKIRVLASTPERDRAELSSRGLAESAEESSTHPVHPRAWRPFYPPAIGSVFKPLVAALALRDGVIAPTTQFRCDFDQVDGIALRCLGSHGSIGLESALERSCNHYFARLATVAGWERLFSWAQEFGFGRATDFWRPALSGLPDFAPARLFPPEVAGELKLHEDRTLRNLMLFGFGQGAVDDVTPLQVAAAMAALATDAYSPPTLIERIGTHVRVVPEPIPLRVPQADRRTVFRGMEAVTVSAHGTARPGSIEGLDLSLYDLATKTGTPQEQGQADSSWFAGFLPTDHPRYAFAIFLERTGAHGGHVCAPILQTLLEDPSFEDVRRAAQGDR